MREDRAYINGCIFDSTTEQVPSQILWNFTRIRTKLERRSWTSHRKIVRRQRSIGEPLTVFSGGVLECENLRRRQLRGWGSPIGTGLA